MSKKDKRIELYRHPIGPERGEVALVDFDAEGDVRLICVSDRGKDDGVVFDISIAPEDYEEMCEDEEVPTMEGSIVEADAGDIAVVETPEDPPLRPERTERGKVRVLKTSAMWTHPWGRCCCVQRGDHLEPVVVERIINGEVSWWGDPLTPFHMDLIAAADDPNNCPMHVLTEDVCGICGHYPWVVFPEDVPEEAPPAPEEVEGDEPLCPERNALSAVEWDDKKEAWETFRLDPHNKRIIEQSELPVARATEKQRYTTEKQFDTINSQPVRSNIYTIKQTFYFAMGPGRSGTWADLDLDIIRLVDGLEDVDIPAVVLEEVDLGDDRATDEMHEQAATRETEATVDDDAEHLEHMMDNGADEYEDITPEVLEPEREPKRRSRKPRKTSTVKQARTQMITAAAALQKALAAFIKAVEEEDADNGNTHAGP